MQRAERVQRPAEGGGAGGGRFVAVEESEHGVAHEFENLAALRCDGRHDAVENSACWRRLSLRPSAARNLHSRLPVFPHGRVNGRPISPFQATYEKLDLACGLALAPPNRFEEDPHRVVAFNYGNCVGRFHDGHIGETATPALLSHRFSAMCCCRQSVRKKRLTG